ncbi:MAG TPA: DUF2279 domain-containing protein [Bacteroidia bacterium]|nr:DUF2279 domain-containing protein [Bacteroidia bacterium]
MRYAAIIILCLFTLHLCAQTDTADGNSSGIRRFACTSAPRVNRKRLLLVAGGETVLAGGSLVALSQLWYKDYPHEKFHFFNDNSEWLQMDKCGHAITSYTLGRYGYNLLRWSDLPEKKCILYGGLTGFAYLTVIEVFDGFSSGWGFSTGDMAANTLGAGLFIGQQLAWHEQRITPKFGYRKSGYAQYRPFLLGADFREQVLKDYNGQTYWLSVNVASFLGDGTKFPGWLNIAVGYGANGMTGGKSNPFMQNAAGNTICFPRYRQLFLSPDIDLTRIPVRSKWLGRIFKTFGFLKIPAPGIELGRGKISGRWLLF